MITPVYSFSSLWQDSESALLDPFERDRAEKVQDSLTVEGILPSKRTSLNGFNHIRFAMALVMLADRSPHGATIDTRDKRKWKQETHIPTMVLDCLDALVEKGFLSSENIIAKGDVKATSKLLSIARPLTEEEIINA